MNIIISNSGETPIYEQITGQIKNMVMSGQLQEGDALPSMRTLARELRISFITTVVGKGSFVRKADTRLIREEKLKRIERLLGEAVLEANRSGISREELLEILEIIYQER